MQKIGSSTSTANGAGEFTSGQPGSGIDATMIMAAWLNTIQRELVNVVQAGGQVLDPADDAQVLKAIKALQELASTWAKISGKPTTINGFGITDAFTKTETSNAIHLAVADLVGSSPDALDTLKELADALGNDPNFATTMTNALAGKAAKATTLAGYGISTALGSEVIAGSNDTKPITPAGFAAGVAAAIAAIDPWAMQQIGVPIAIFDHINGVAIPPTTNGYRYIKLTASDAYNAGVLTSESVTGTAPLVNATALINLAGSPINGQAVRLINTERRGLRAGSSGVAQDDQFQGHSFGDGSRAMRSAPAGVTDGGEFLRLSSGGLLSIMTDGVNGTPRIGNETRSRNVGATYYMRIK
ncbi:MULTISPECIES: hypothetical protein [Pseudomonas]|uniref:hypothetical protein n=1 Tax=Pseudomonas TaxID=286 RepID=UPI0021CCB1C9|nr:MULTISPECIES: hypothetical protein [Pseudomonas]